MPTVIKEEPPIISSNDTIVIPDTETAPAGAPMEERVISVDRVSRTQKGGRRMRFRAVVIVGDRQGSVGMGIGKSNEITAAVAKATYKAKKTIITVPIVRHTIPHEITFKFDTARVLLKPASVGTSIIAGSSVRPILELAGVENVVGKCLTRTTNKINNAYATLGALKSLLDIKTLPERRYKKPSKRKAADVTQEKTVEAEVVVDQKPAKKTTKKSAK